MKNLFGSFFVMLLALGCSNTPVVQEKSVDDREQKDMLIEVAGRVYARELLSGTGGDISVKVPGKNYFYIKATGMCVGDLDYDKLSKVGFDGKVFEGSPQPSHETNIHCALYNRDENIGAIMHIHSPYATAWATTGKKIPPVTQQSVNLFRNMGIIPYSPPGSKEMLDAVMKCYENPETQVVLMENHGTFIKGADLYDILYKAEVIENTARIAYLCKDIGTPKEFVLKDNVLYKSPY